MELVITAIIALLLGGGVVFIIKRVQDENKKKSARIEAERIINKAKSEAMKL